MAGFFGEGRQAAVSLTFDDGLDVHLEVVMPLLEAAGLRGTFYVNPDTDYDYGGYVSDGGGGDGAGEQVAESKWERQIGGWVSAAARGHEVGNHTTHHPCSCNYGFSDPCLEEMTIDDIAATIDDAEVRSHPPPHSSRRPAGRPVTGALPATCG